MDLIYKKVWRRLVAAMIACIAVAMSVGEAWAYTKKDCNHINDIYWSGRYADVIRLTDSLTAGYRPGVTVADSTILDLWGYKASALYRTDMPDKAVEVMRTSLGEMERLFGRFNKWYADACTSMASYCYASQAYFKECAEWESLGIQIRKAIGDKEDFSRLYKMYETSWEIGESLSPKTVSISMPIIYDTDCRRSWEKSSDVQHYRRCCVAVEELAERGDTLSPLARKRFAELAEAALPLGYYDVALEAAGVSWWLSEELSGRESVDALDGAYRYAYVLQVSQKDVLEPKRMCNSIVYVLDSLGRNDCELYVNALMLASTGYSHMGVGGNAMDNARKAVEAARRIGGEDSRLYDAARFLLGQQEFRFGSRKKALELTEKSVEWRRRNLPEGHPDHVNALLSYAGFLTQEGREPDALPLYEEFVRLQTDNIRNNFVGMTVDEQKKYWDQYQFCYKSVMPQLFSHISRGMGNRPVYAPLAYNSALIYKGLLLNSERYMAEILKDSDSTNIRRLEEIAELKYRRDALLALESDRRSENVYELSRRIYGLQRDLLLDKKDYARYIDRLLTDWRQVKASLRSGEAAVEFLSISEAEQLFTYSVSRNDFLNGDSILGRHPVGERMRDDLAAVVITPDFDRPVFVYLGDLNDFGYFEVGNIDSERRMRRLVWDRLLDMMPASTTDLYFSPDGRLHQMAVESLTGLDGGIRLHRVTSTAELIRRRNQTLHGSSVLAYGGLVYDSEGESDQRGSRKGSSEIAYLPGSLREVNNIRDILKERVTVVTGQEGTERHFRQFAASTPGIIHLSTHGFFISPESAVDREKSREADSRDIAMLSSGVLFAGATADAVGLSAEMADDDGVMTAAEIAMLNLDGTRMVVLSACESGLGRVGADGVFGLQRGFKKAGAGSLLMSLWRVDDDATERLMTEFYRNLSTGRTPHASLEAAKRAVRSVEKWSHPRYWASFVLIDGL